jgi:hypothetical protein
MGVRERPLRHRNDVNLSGIRKFAVEHDTGVELRCHHVKEAVPEQHLENRTRHGGRRDLYADPRVRQRGVAARLEMCICREPVASVRATSIAGIHSRWRYLNT